MEVNCYKKLGMYKSFLERLTSNSRSLITTHDGYLVSSISTSISDLQFQLGHWGSVDLPLIGIEHHFWNTRKFVWEVSHFI